MVTAPQWATMRRHCPTVSSNYSSASRLLSASICWREQVVLLFSDNWAAVCAANSGRASDPLIRASIRELWWLCAYHDVELIIRHRPGANMQDVDTLISQRCFGRFREWERNTKESRMQLPPKHLAPPARI